MLIDVTHDDHQVYSFGKDPATSVLVNFERSWSGSWLVNERWAA